MLFNWLRKPNHKADLTKAHEPATNCPPPTPGVGPGMRWLLKGVARAWWTAKCATCRQPRSQLELKAHNKLTFARRRSRDRGQFLTDWSTDTERRHIHCHQMALDQCVHVGLLSYPNVISVILSKSRGHGLHPLKLRSIVAFGIKLLKIW